MDMSLVIVGKGFVSKRKIFIFHFGGEIKWRYWGRIRVFNVNRTDDAMQNGQIGHFPRVGRICRGGSGAALGGKERGLPARNYGMRTGCPRSRGSRYRLQAVVQALIPSPQV
jgi:hypothetical protein